jgi:hypothetical protein
MLLLKRGKEIVAPAFLACLLVGGQAILNSVSSRRRTDMRSLIFLGNEKDYLLPIVFSSLPIV